MNRSISLLCAALFCCSSAQSIKGSGASFPAPLYKEMFAQYKKISGVDVTYESIGSGGGQKAILDRSVDFAGSDSPISAAQRKSAPGELIHVATALGAVVPAYNLPNIKANLKFDSDTLSKIFLGKITKWNDSALRRLNPNVSLPDLKISVVHRSDSSGTTYVFSDYLSKTSADWKGSMGTSNEIKWKTGTGAKGNSGVADAVKNTTGSLGYVEMTYALQNNLSYGDIINQYGTAVRANTQSVSESVKDVYVPKDMLLSITNSPNPKAYPISSFTYIILYKEQSYAGRSKEDADRLLKLAKWMVGAGQNFRKDLGYVPLPAQAQRIAQNLLESVTYQGGKL